MRTDRTALYILDIAKLIALRKADMESYFCCGGRHQKKFGIT